MTERWTMLMEAVGERKRSWWMELLRFALLFAALSGASYGVLWILGFPKEVGMLFAGVLGAQGCGLAWITAGIRGRVRQSIVEVRYESHLLRRRGWVAMAAFAVGFALYVVFTPKTIWSQTLCVIGLVLAGLYGAFALISAQLLEWEGGKLSYGFAGRWIGRITSLMIASTGMALILLFNFLGGIHWWYNAYVTTERRKKVVERNRYLKDLKLTTLFDRHKRYMGLYKKTESDWSTHYNDPDILKWKLSQAIQMAEGAVRKPAWWWRYLPDGERLQCEPFSLEAFLRVPYYFIKQRRKVGGSTPALQAAKNFLDFGGSRRSKGLLNTVRAKLFAEMPRAYIMCQAFSTREMMAIYQATLWAGKGANYGIHRMALHFFGVDQPPQLNWNQAAVLAASLPNPGRLNPWYLESCRKGKCASKRKQQVYDVWSKRIALLKAKMRGRGIKVSPELPAFQSKLNKLQAISYKWKNHDLHVRSWIQKLIQQKSPNLKDWQAGARIQLHYDRKLTVGTPDRDGLAHIAQTAIDPFRFQIEDLQVSYTLVDSRNGRIVSQYGGDGNVDMALALKPVVGSTFKVITLMVADQWPDALPFLNKGRTTANRRRFIYHPTPSRRGHWVRNSHSMPPYVDKEQALTISANIGFVFFSLRWTWMASPLRWIKVMSVGLKQMFMEKRKMTAEQATKVVEALLKEPVKLRRELVRNFGFKPYLQNLRENAIFEAAKAATVKSLLGDTEVDKKHLTEFLALEPNDPMETFSQKIKDAFAREKDAVTRRFTGEMSLEELSWVREFRMEMGLRYINDLARQIAGYDLKKNHLLPVMTMTLGVNDADTRQLASVASFVSSKTLRQMALLNIITKGKESQSWQQDIIRRPPVSSEALDKVRKAMKGVLTSGTAAGAGRIVKQKFGEKALENSGAKTGTVQSSRGVSCVGYMGHYAGALTLSTPTNETLKAYRVKRSLTRKLALYERRQKYWYKRFEKAGPGSRRARYYMRRALANKRAAQEKRKEVLKLQKFGQRYYRLRKKHKALEKAAQAAQKAARTYRRRIARSDRRIRSYTRRVEREQRRIDAARQKIEDLGGVKDMSARERRRHRLYKGRMDRATKRQAKWKARRTKATARRAKYIKRRAKALDRFQRLTSAAVTAKQKYSGMTRRFFRTHQRWNLSSAKACRILFTLLATWKEWEEKIEPAPKDDISDDVPKIKPNTLTIASSNSTSATSDAGPTSSAPDARPARSTEPMATDAGAPGAGGTSTPDASAAKGDRKAAKIPDQKTRPDAKFDPNKRLNDVLRALRPKKAPMLKKGLLPTKKPKKRPILLPPPPQIRGERE